MAGITRHVLHNVQELWQLAHEDLERESGVRLEQHQTVAPETIQWNHINVT